MRSARRRGDLESKGSPEGRRGIGPSTCQIEVSQLEICNNGIDDNGDGLIACADPTCAAAARLAHPAPFAARESRTNW